MVTFIDEHRDEHGVEPICEQLPIAPSTYYKHKAEQADPESRSARAKRHEALAARVLQVWVDNYEVYGYRKVHAQLRRDGEAVSHGTVELLMRQLGIRGATRGRAWTTTTRSGGDGERPDDLVDRQFDVDAPDRLWVCDFTYVATWAGFVYVAFVVDAFANRIVGWRVMSRMTADLPLDALEQAIVARLPAEGADGQLVAHSDAGSQYLAMRYGQRLIDEDILPSVGSVGDAYDNALVESIIGLFKTEVIRRRGPWRTIDDVEFAVLEWVDWFNHRRLMAGPDGYSTPAEREDAYVPNHPDRTPAGTPKLKPEALR